MIHESARYPLVHGWILLAGGLDVEELDQGLDGDALDKHGPVDHGDRRRYEHGSVGDLLQMSKEGKKGVIVILFLYEE